MVQRLPFYMVYGGEKYMRNRTYGDEEVQFQRDCNYMKSTYPNMAKRIIPYIEEECDRIEYSGSMIFDEYPDQLQIYLMCRRIMERFINEEAVEKNGGKYSVKRIQGEVQDNWLHDFIWILTWQEILRRRSAYRKYREMLL